MIFTHSTTWWYIKVICGFLLIYGIFDRYIFHYLDLWFTLPTIISQALVITGGGITIYHYYLLKKQNPGLSEPATLVHQDGLFRFIRHPMYFGDMILYLGLLTFSANAVTLFLLILGYLGLFKQAQVEDDYLKSRFGKQFSAWGQKTNLLIPFIRSH